MIEACIGGNRCRLCQTALSGYCLVYFFKDCFATCFYSIVIMVNVELSTLEIRILLKCDKKLLSRTDISQLYKKFTKTYRDAAIKTLLNYDLIEAIEKPKEGASKIPIFYQITPKGKNWVKSYNKNYPE